MTSTLLRTSAAQAISKWTTTTATGVLRFSGNNTYDGTTTIKDGSTLLVDGTNSGAGAVTVQTGARLGGTGSIAAAVTVENGCVLDAGTTSTTEDLATGNLIVNGTLSAQINGASAGAASSGYDQIKVTGTVNLSGATLDVSGSTHTPVTGNSFKLIDNDGSDAITGTFAGLAEGATITVNGVAMNISYQSGDGNDVVLSMPNAAPVLDASKSPALAGVLQNSSAPTNGSTTGATLVSALINTGALANYSDSDGNPAGIAITGKSTNGSLYYSTNSGATWTAVGAVSATSAQVLKADASTYLYFKPNAGYSGSINDALTIKAWDQTGAYTNGQSGVNVDATLQLTSTYDTPGVARGIAVNGNYAYLADYSPGLQIFNISNPASPSLEGTYTNVNTVNARAVVVNGGYAYLANAGNNPSLQIVDISDPANPAFKATITTPGSYAYSVAVNGNFAYVACAEAGLQVINVSDPAHPSLLGTYTDPNPGTKWAYGIAVSGNYAYVAYGSAGLNIINISNPASPSLVGTYDTPGDATGVTVSGNYAYVADYDKGLQVINISNPASPSLAGTYDTTGYAYFVTVSGDYAYVADDTGGLQLINISNLASPSLVATYDTPGAARGVTVNGNYAYVADYTSGLQIIEMVSLNSVSSASDTVSVSVTNPAPPPPPPNSPPTGNITIGGTATQGQTLTASNTLADNNGLGSISYQWKADGTAINGATGSTLVLGQDQVGKTITVTASYTDGGGTAESVTSSASSVVANINDTPTGSVTISGTPTQGQTLTASNTLADIDGLGTIQYQWYAADTSITGATGSTLTLTQDHVGKTITVKASYTDGFKTAESVSSDATTAVANINDVPTGTVTISGTATQGQTLTASNTLADIDGLGTIQYQWYAADAPITGATGSTLTLTQGHVGKAITVKASYTDGFKTAESISSDSKTIANINDVPTGSVTISGTPTQGQTLTASNTLADADGLGAIQYQWYAANAPITDATGSTLALTQDHVGKAITVKASYIDVFKTAESVSSDTTTITNINDTPTGNVTISGTPTQGQTLTASNTLVDIDGMGTIQYQWLMGDTPISDATGSTLTLTQDHVDKTITVKASYTDGFKTAESVSSDTTTIANINDTPTGNVTISGTPTQGQTLTASNTLADIDGLGAIQYQWYTADTPITEATGSTLALTQDHVGKAITVKASYIDVFKTAESVSSDATTIANINDAPTGNVTISGTPTQGQTLTASNTLADADGLGTIQYQWFADNTAISGATDNTLTLTQAQIGKTITVIASYTDGFNTFESVSSGPTVAIISTNNAPSITSGSSASVAENAPASTVVYTATATDPDADTLSYTLTGPDAASLTIDAATGAVNLKTPANFEAQSSYSFNVVVSDNASPALSHSAAITLSVTDINEAPTMAASAQTLVAENGIANALVYTASAQDVDANTTLSYSLSGPDASAFSIDATTGALHIKTPTDFEAKPLYNAIVTASDNGLSGVGQRLSVTQDLRIVVTDVNEAPSITSGTSAVVANNSPVDTLVYKTTASDPDAGDVLTYSLLGADASLLNVNPTTGAITLKTASDINTKPSYSFNVIASDKGTLSASKAISVQVTADNQNAPPVITSGNGAASITLASPENQTEITTITANDPNASDTVTFSIAGGADQSAFTLNAQTGILRFTNAPDFEQPTDAGKDNGYEVIIQASDGKGGQVSQTITVQVSDVQEDTSTIAPSIQLSPGSDTGISDTDNLINKAVIALTGQAEAFATITVSDARGNAIGSTQASQSGVWTLSGVNLATLSNNAGTTGGDGLYTLSAKAVDLALNQSTASTLTVELDTSAPPAPLTLQLDTASDSTPVGDGKTSTLTPNFTVTLPQGATNTDRLSLTADLDGNGSFETKLSTTTLTAAQIAAGTVTLSIDAHTFPDNRAITFLASLIDKAGNTSTGASTTVAFVTDFDGITPATENAGTAGGDFNGDGLADSQQSDVATAPMTNAQDFNNANSGNGGNASYGSLIAGDTNGDGTPDNQGSIQLSDVGVSPAATAAGGLMLQDLSAQGLGASSDVINFTATADANHDQSPDTGGFADADPNRAGAQVRITIELGGNGVSATKVMKVRPDGSSFDFTATSGDVDGGQLIDTNGDGKADRIILTITDNGIGDFDARDGVITDPLFLAKPNTAPVFTSHAGAASANLSTAENTSAVDTLVASDADNDVLSFSISGGLDAGKFTINSTSGVLSFVTAPDFEKPGDSDQDNVYHVTIQASDGLGGLATQALAVNVTNIADTGVISYSATTFVEAAANDGSIATTSTITLSQDSFTGAVGATLGTVSNVPAGLSAALIKTSATTASLSFTGKAATHANANDINNLSVRFSDADFSSGLASSVTNATLSGLKIDFADPAPIIVTPEPIKSLSYSTTTFVEAAANDGSIATTSTITLSNDSFSGAIGAALGTVSNVPVGLNATLIKTSANTATLAFTGKAAAHSNANDVNNLSVSFSNADFSSGLASSVTNATLSGLVIDFADSVLPPGKVVDGVTVSVQSGTDTLTNLEQQTLTIPAISASRVEDTSTANATLADIGLDVSINTPAIQAQLAAALPIGVAMTASGPTTLLTGAQASTDLLGRINQKATTPAASEMVAAAQSFLASLGNASVLDKTITLTASATPNDTLLTGNAAKPEAIVLDASGLPVNSIVQLDNVDFSAVVGALRVTGGAGNNRIVGDASAQWFAMGAGNDTLSGGAGDDVLSGARSDVGQWTFYLDANGAIQAQYQGGNLTAAALDNKHADMYFLNASVASVKQVALLYAAAFGRATDLGGLNFYLTQQSAPEQIAKALLNAPEWSTVHGSAGSAMGNEAFINGLYQTALSRVADTAGKQFWLDALGKGLGREQVVLAFANSSEMQMHWTTHKASALASATQITERGWIASSGDDRIDGGSGSDTLVGGDGTDTVVYSGALPSYKFLLTKGGEIKVADTATGARDTLLGFELGAFNGQQFDISFTQATQAKLNTLGLLYQTILDRPADVGGLNYWLKADLSIQQYAQGMLVDTEFVQRNENGPLSDKAFVELLYHNTPSRDADAAGLKF
ncbi:MAG: cadherin domain-containing protein [Rhodoferax sp.]|nr:cadherin domain-containing protein [Rhodoferax sp.]